MITYTVTAKEKSTGNRVDLSLPFGKKSAAQDFIKNHKKDYAETRFSHFRIKEKFVHSWENNELDDALTELIEKYDISDIAEKLIPFLDKELSEGSTGFMREHLEAEGYIVIKTETDKENAMISEFIGKNYSYNNTPLF